MKNKKIDYIALYNLYTDYCIATLNDVREFAKYMHMSRDVAKNTISQIKHGKRGRVVYPPNEAPAKVYIYYK